jgi:hypothetical protein
MENFECIEKIVTDNINYSLMNLKNNKDERSKFMQTISLTLRDKLKDTIQNSNYIIYVFILEKGSTYLYHKTSCFFDSKDKHLLFHYSTSNWICKVSIYLSCSIGSTLRLKQTFLSEMTEKIRKICRFQIKKLIKLANKEYIYYQNNVQYYCDIVRDLIQIELRNKYSFGVDCMITKNDKQWVSFNWSGFYNKYEDSTVCYSTQHCGFWCILTVSFFRHI